MQDNAVNRELLTVSFLLMLKNWNFKLASQKLSCMAKCGRTQQWMGWAVLYT